MSEQISRPYQVLLGVALVGLLLWFVALRPGDEEAAPAAQAPAAATAVAPTPPTATAAPAPASAPTAAAPAPAPVPVPAVKTPVKTASAEDLSAPIISALDAGRVAVVLFHEPQASDDRAVLRAVRSLSTRDGDVAVFDAPIDDVGSYAAITRGVQVRAAPTVLVIGPDRKARTIVGFTGRGEIDQLVGDVLYATRDDA